MYKNILSSIYTIAKHWKNPKFQKQNIDTFCMSLKLDLPDNIRDIHLTFR
jgi:hypothetical protein